MASKTEINPAATYEAFMVPPLFGPWAAKLVTAVDPRPGEHVLDVACGTGIVARTVAAHASGEAEIAAIDLNPQMLEVARDVSASDGQTITWQQGRAEEMPFATGSFDVVLCQFSLMFFSNPGAALSEMRRVLRGGGRVGLSVFQEIDRHPFYRALDEAIERHLGESAVSAIFSLGNRDKLEQLLVDAGFHDVQITPVSMTASFPNPDGFLAGEIDVDTAAIPAMQGLDTAARQELTETLTQEMTQPLAAVTSNDRVEMPFHVWFGFGRR